MGRPSRRGESAAQLGNKPSTRQEQPECVLRTGRVLLRVQVPNNHILTQTLYYSYHYPNPKYLIIGYMDPLGSCEGTSCPSQTGDLRRSKSTGSRANKPGKQDNVKHQHLTDPPHPSTSIPPFQPYLPFTLLNASDASQQSMPALGIFGTPTRTPNLRRFEPTCFGSWSAIFGSFPKLGVPFLGAPIIRIIIFWGLYWGPPILGNYHLKHWRPHRLRECY